MYNIYVSMSIANNLVELQQVDVGAALLEFRKRKWH